MDAQTYLDIARERDRLADLDNASLNTLLIETQKKYFAGLPASAQHPGHVREMYEYSTTITAINTIWHDRAEAAT